MKKALVILIHVLLIFLFVSCSGGTPAPSEDGGQTVQPGGNDPDTGSNPSEDGVYRVESNIDVIGDNKPVVFRSAEVRTGDEIIGVLLDYNDEDPNVFYLEFNDGGEIRQNGDGMKYNYVLYIPPYIGQVYKEAGGVNPDSGNPFWWYMSTYFDLSMSAITQNYENALNILLDRKGEELPAASASDLKEDWKAEGAGEEDVSDIEYPSTAKSELILLRYGNATGPVEDFTKDRIDCQNKGPFAQLDDKGEVVTNAFYIDKGGKMYYPMVLADVYAEQEGRYTTSGSPFWRYTEVFFDVSIEDSRKGNFMFSDLLNKIIDYYEKHGSLPYPSVEAYEKYFNEHPEDFEGDIQAYSEFFDMTEEPLRLEIEEVKPGIDLSDPETSNQFDTQRKSDAYIENPCEEAWLTFDVTPIGKIWYPAVLDYVYWQYNQDYTSGGTPFLYYLEVYFGITREEIDNGGIDVVITALKEKNAAAGGIPYPDAEDYRSYANK